MTGVATLVVLAGAAIGIGAGVAAGSAIGSAATQNQQQNEPQATPQTAPATASARAGTQEEQSGEYAVRVQVQGRKLSVGEAGASEVLSSDRPITAAEVQESLGSLSEQLTPRDRRLLGDSFERADRFVSSAANSNPPGAPPGVSRSYSRRDVPGKDARVDIEIQRGWNLVLPEL